jgi:hypothetical protein
MPALRLSPKDLLLFWPQQAKMGRLARHRGYTLTALVEELVERAERRVTARLPSRALKAYYDTQ